MAKDYFILQTTGADGKPDPAGDSFRVRTDRITNFVQQDPAPRLGLDQTAKVEAKSTGPSFGMGGRR